MSEQTTLTQRERYESVWRPAAQKAIQIIESLPPEATFKKRIELMKTVVLITQQTLITAHESMIESLPAEVGSIEEEAVATGKSIEKVQKEKRFC